MEFINPEKIVDDRMEQITKQVEWRTFAFRFLEFRRSTWMLFTREIHIRCEEVRREEVNIFRRWRNPKNLS